MCVVHFLKYLFSSVMTHKLSCIGIIIYLKFIYHRVEYSTFFGFAGISGRLFVQCIGSGGIFLSLF